MKKAPMVELNSPYGFLTTAGSGRIYNGRVGVVKKYSTSEKCEVIFEGENEEVKVPCHWITELETKASCT